MGLNYDRFPNDSDFETQLAIVQAEVEEPIISPYNPGDLAVGGKSAVKAQLSAERAAYNSYMDEYRKGLQSDIAEARGKKPPDTSNSELDAKTTER